MASKCRVNCEDCGQTYVLAGVRRRLWVQELFCNKRGYVIYIFCVKSAGPRRSVHYYRGYVISESVIMKFYCILLTFSFVA